MDLAYAAGRTGGTMTGVLSAANEQVDAARACHESAHACLMPLRMHMAPTTVILEGSARVFEHLQGNPACLLCQ